MFVYFLFLLPSRTFRHRNTPLSLEYFATGCHLFHPFFAIFFCDMYPPPPPAAEGQKSMTHQDDGNEASLVWNSEERGRTLSHVSWNCYFLTWTQKYKVFVKQLFSLLFISRTISTIHDPTLE